MWLLDHFTVAGLVQLPNFSLGVRRGILGEEYIQRENSYWLEDEEMHQAAGNCKMATSGLHLLNPDRKACWENIFVEANFEWGTW